MSDDPQTAVSPGRVQILPPERVDTWAPLDPLGVKLQLELDEATHKRSEASLDNAAKRKREDQKHIAGLVFIALLSIVATVVVIAAIIYTASIIFDPSASSEAKQAAAAVAGAIFGAAATFLFTEVPKFFSKKSDGG
jgi:high-affinity Fe2+/Pb2+ permease